MNPRKLDHVAVRVSDPERTAAELLTRFPFRIIERSEDFLLVGRDPALGKITLLEATSPPEQGRLVRIGIGIPCGMASMSFDLADGLVVELVPMPADGEVELSHVALRVSSPETSARRWNELGFRQEASSGGVHRVRLGSGLLELHPGPAQDTDHPLLDHIGLAVDSVEAARAALAETDMSVTREVEAENSLALFVDGPDGVEVELIEHKPSFALV